MTILHGIDINSNVIPLLVDASGRVIVSADEPSNLNPVGTLASYSTLTLAAGNQVLTVYTVPGGQRMRLTQAVFRYTGTVTNVKVELLVTDGATLVYFHNALTVTSNLFVPVSADITMEAGWIVKATVLNATLNDDFFMAIAMQRYK